jgi:hypothetical protein
VQRAREQPLAGAGLPLDQHRRQPPDVTLPIEEPLDLLPHRLDAGAVAEQLGQGIHAVHLTPAAQITVQLLTTSPV